MTKASAAIMAAAGVAVLGVAVAPLRSLGSGVYSLRLLGYELAVHFDVSRASAETPRGRHTNAGWPTCTTTVDTIYVRTGEPGGRP